MLSLIFVVFLTNYLPTKLDTKSLSDIYSQVLSVIIQALAGIMAIFGVFLVYLLGLEKYPKADIMNDYIIYAGAIVIGSLFFLSFKDIIFLYYPPLGVFFLFLFIFVTVWILIDFIYMFVTLPEREPPIEKKS